MMTAPAARRPRVRSLTPAEARADALLAQIPDDELDALARVLARVLLSAAKNRRAQQALAPQGVANPKPKPVRKPKPTPVRAQKRAVRS